jgi:hypothetical protein
MARIDGPVRDQSTGSGGVISLQYGLALKAVFGRALVCKARETDPADIDLTAAAMQAVHDAADELLAIAGDSEEQGRVVERLDPSTRLALCLWMIDPSLGPTLAARAMYAPMPMRG